jgi:AmiR/NasT family two-component response regulator
VATIALLQERSIADAERTSDQLQTALNSRVLIEQAKGRIAERTGCPMTVAFDRLRSYARSHNRRLSDASAAVVSGDVTVDEVMS